MGSKIHLCKAHELTFPECDFYIGTAGQVDASLEVADFFRYPDTWAKPPSIPRGSLQGLVLTEKGDIYYFSNPGKWTRIHDKVFAIGSGSLTAIGALHAGASPKDAVKAASKVDPFTGMGYKSFTFK